MKKKPVLPDILTAYYDGMMGAFGPQGWWPGDTRFEVVVGAILTQNTSWTNVEKAIKRLKKERLLTPRRMHALREKDLAEIIRPAGYFNIKAQRLKNFLNSLFTDHGGSLAMLFRNDTGALRRGLLSVNGIGPETADSIILYAAGRPEFVVDAYTRRLLLRHGLIKEDAGYDDIKELFTKNLPGDPVLFNEYHALIVRTGKDFCKTKDPLCGACPLKPHMEKP